MKMEQKYTRAQISEAIKYWTKQLKRMNESTGSHRVEIKLIDLEDRADVPDECDWVYVGTMTDAELKKFKAYVSVWNDEGYDKDFEKYADIAKADYVKNASASWSASEYAEEFDSPDDAWDEAWNQSEAAMGYLVKVDGQEIDL